MIDLLKIDVGKPYPGEIIDGVVVDFFSGGGSPLRIGMPQIISSEKHAYRKGKVRFGLIAKDGALLTLWKFGNQPWIDAPFDAPLARHLNRLHLDDINPRSQLLIDMHLVDTQTNIVKALRAFTLSTGQTTAVTSAIQDQLSNGASFDALARLLAVPTDQLAANNEIK